ncbi:MAG: TatD family hydrolase [Cryomorphaceae bacterium]|nr:TatD family hydrolase [Cryomorphaceae bacterium]
MIWIDTHNHLYLPEFNDDRAAVIDRAVKTGVTKLFLPNVDLRTAADLLALCDQRPETFFPMMGLHPCSVKNDWREVLPEIKAILEREIDRIIAVGEIGLDLYWDKSTLDIQQRAFSEQIEWALAFDLPIVIHVRDAFAETFEVIKDFDGRGLKGVFHCFTGNVEQAEFIQSRNMYVGLGGVSTFKNGGMGKVIPHLERSLVVLETDAPYLAPVPHRGKRNEPSYIPIIAERVANLWDCELLEVSNQTTKNALTLFSNAKS